MIPNLLLMAVLSLNQSASIGPDKVRFDKPSEAFAYANSPMAEWEAAVNARKPPKTRIAPTAEVWHRAKALCPTFAVEDVSGEELYWLANLCKSKPNIGLTALHSYLKGNGQQHRPEAHLLLSELEGRTTQSWVSAWDTLRTILQEDPIESQQEVRVRVAIGDEADKNEATALQWSEERYFLLLERLQNPKPGTPRVSPEYLIMAGADLAHRYYLAGRRDDATLLLWVLDAMQAQNVGQGGWAAVQLNWANMETKPAPPIPVLHAAGGNPGTDIVQRGRVEVVSFFFLRCFPCISEMPELDDFQKRYPKNKVLVVDVTTYKVALQPDAPSHREVESAIGKLGRKKSHHLTMAVTAEQVLDDYGIYSFPVLAVIDKAGRLRYAGFSNDFDSGEAIDRLVRQLLDEQLEP